MMSKKIAVLINASIYNQKGLFNAAHERVKHLCSISEFSFDLYLISPKKSSLSSFLTNEKERSYPESYFKDGLLYKIIWLHNTILDYILVHKLNKLPICSHYEFRKYLPLFKEYDLIESHAAGSFAYQIYNKYSTPFIITWHGSDIHSIPFKSKDFWWETKKLIESAAHNLFVSQALLKTSDSITKEGRKSVSYNGRDSAFVCYSQERKKELRADHSIEGKKIVAYVGNLIPIKNIKSLPGIFRIISLKEPDTLFWIIGDGPLKKQLADNTKDIPIHFWGNVPHKKIIDFMNMIDILVLPSINEGLPLVTVEALSCGCHVVGSRVGGIPEAIGIENTIELNDSNFEEKMANKAIQLLKSGEHIYALDCFDWDKTALEEKKIIQSVINQ